MLDQAAELGVQWVTADALEQERKLTAELEAEAQSLAAEKDAKDDPRSVLMRWHLKLQSVLTCCFALLPVLAAWSMWMHRQGQLLPSAIRRAD